MADCEADQAATKTVVSVKRSIEECNEQEKVDGPQEEVDSVVEVAKVVKPQDPLRIKMIEMIAKALKKDVVQFCALKSPSESPKSGTASLSTPKESSSVGSKDGQDEFLLQLVESVAIEIELAIFTECKTINQQYKTLSMRLCTALNTNSHSELRARLIEGSMEPTDFVKMTPMELMSPAVMRAVETKLMEEKKFEEERQKRQRGRSGVYACRKCRSYNTTTALLQTRRADEGMTLFINCHSCGRTTRG